MTVQGKIKFRFDPGKDSKAITGGKRGYFPHYIIMHAGKVLAEI